MSQNDKLPAGTENYPVNNYIPKSNPNSRPKKFTKYAYVIKNQVEWDRMHKRYVVLEGKGKQETQPIPLLHKDNRKAYEDACDVCKWHYKNREARTLYVTDGTYISPTAIKRMRELP